MIHQANEEYSSSLISFAAFCGAWGIIVAAVGVVAAFVDRIPGFIMAGVDGLTTLFFIAASIVSYCCESLCYVANSSFQALAKKLGVHSCQADKDSLKDIHYTGKIGKYASAYTFFNDILNGGYAPDTNFNFVARCQEAQADDAFLFFALAAFCASIILDFCGGRGGSNTSSSGGGFKFPKIGRKGASYV